MREVQQEIQKVHLKVISRRLRELVEIVFNLFVSYFHEKVALCCGASVRQTA
jgi:hypothetical protein